MSLKDISLFRTFTSAKLVHSRLLNRMGIQVARTYAARGVYQLRPTPRNPDIQTLVQSLKKDGLVTIENFFNDDLFEKVKNECLAMINSKDETLLTSKNHGPTQYDIALLRNFPETSYENVQKFYEDPRLKGLLESAEKRRFNMSMAHRCVERVRQGTETTEGDPETVLHSDIFFPTHKAWLYLTDVQPQDAPLVFVRGSHKLSVEQAKQIYRHSCRPETPSRRITNMEMERLGLREEVMACKKNTLVVANVCGYHRRSQGQPGGERIALHCSIRSQPFFHFLDRVVDVKKSRMA